MRRVIVYVFFEGDETLEMLAEFLDLSVKQIQDMNPRFANTMEKHELNLRNILYGIKVSKEGFSPAEIRLGY
jgi:hypothetical protein